MINKKIKEALNVLHGVCSTYDRTTCPKCPLYIKFNDRGCLFTQGKVPEFLDTFLVDHIAKQVTESTTLNGLREWNPNFSKVEDGFSINNMVAHIGDYIVHDADDKWIVIPKEKYEQKYV